MSNGMEDRVSELEIVLENLLECFEETPEGVTAETLDETVIILSQDVADAVERARDLLYASDES
jgi:hypothetical protein